MNSPDPIKSEIDQLAAAKEAKTLTWIKNNKLGLIIGAVLGWLIGHFL